MFLRSKSGPAQIKFNTVLFFFRFNNLHFQYIKFKKRGTQLEWCQVPLSGAS